MDAASTSSWWHRIDESPEWQKTIFYGLSAAYGVVAFIALVQLVRIQVRVPEYGWTTQKLFHLMNLIVNGFRALLFGFYFDIFHIKLEGLKLALLDLPGLLFFSTYTLLVLFWAEIYYQARNLSMANLRPTYFMVNGAVYIVQIGIWLYIQIHSYQLVDKIAKVFVSVVSFFAALGFLVYGGRLFFMLRRFPLESKGRQKKLNEVGLVTAICCFCFLIRCIVSGLSALEEEANVDVLDHPVLDLFFYMLVEIVPSALVLFILRKLPPKRVSDQYHPIN